MARFKRARAVLHTTRDKRGRFAKPQEPLNFFSLPLEIRSIVYEYCFSWEHQQPTELFCESKNTLALKHLVLRTSRTVFSEALPVFWKCHILRIRMAVSPDTTLQYFPKVRPIPKLENIDWFSQELSRIGWVAPMKQLLTRLELMAPTIIYGVEWGDIPMFSCILLNFPNLRLLRLDLTAIADHGSLESDDQRLAQPNAKMTGMIGELWTRLDRLEIVMVHYMDDSLVEFRKAIGPGPHWDQEVTSKELCGGMRSIWSLQRPRETLADAKLARQIAATNRWSTYAHLQLMKPETWGNPCWAGGRRFKKIENAY
ncbi:MAG: hypothetical protein OHK93_005317 [Ramalina farinacea]|uniref:F-box domain-containing protein n=1 Tax=Ramalina farinacea TaxID=258253 RepID=A0AA43QW64_9LECA|nr:hypothetical protein [Ramalina farinacea]